MENTEALLKNFPGESGSRTTFEQRREFDLKIGNAFFPIGKKWLK